MGNSKVKTSAKTISPWLIYTEPAVQDPRFSILETYYPDELEAAVPAAIAAVQRRKHMLTLDVLNHQKYKVLRDLIKFVPMSRSTPEFQKGIPKKGIILNCASGYRSL